MEPAQKRQRTAATTMQRISLLPKELQAKILMSAMEPTPTAAIVDAAIDFRYGEPCWWRGRVVDKDRGYEKYLICHTHNHRLWARVLEVQHDASLAWKWSQTNVWVNRTGRAYRRGKWLDLWNEYLIRQRVRGHIPDDKYVEDGGFARELRMHIPPADSTLADVPHETLLNTLGYAMVNDPLDGYFRLQWGDVATRHASTLDHLGHSTLDVRDYHRKVLIECGERLYTLVQL